MGEKRPWTPAETGMDPDSGGSSRHSVRVVAEFATVDEVGSGVGSSELRSRWGDVIRLSGTQRRTSPIS